MGTGLTFDEYVELKLRPPVRADRAFHHAAEQEREQMFPMTTTAASHHLRGRRLRRFLCRRGGPACSRY
jgi:hypothetical protein